MSRRDEIKVYNSVEERVDDYENFKDDWDYDADKQEGRHKSGLEMRFMILDRAKIEQPNLVEWQKKMEAEGLTEHEIKQYRVMLLNQFAVMLDENPPEEKEPTIDERIKDMEEADKQRLQWMREDNRSEEDIALWSERWRKYREEKRKELEQEKRLQQMENIREKVKGSKEDR